MSHINKPKVVVGMSGGVDSSMAATLLKEQGYDVIGVTLQIWEAAGPEGEGGCCSISAVDDARRVAYQIGIPHYVLNFRSYFNQKVIDYFIKSYLAGETPNPCLACNRYVKFDELLRKARGLGAEYIATGHYAKVTKDGGSGRLLLRESSDVKKDQTYALYMLTQEQLAHTLFPLSDYTKEHIREMARERNIGVANKPDSQEICFVPDDDYGSFIRERAGEKVRPGNFVDLQGRLLGRHKGLVYYTVGQRKGLGSTFGKPMFVVALNPERNEVILGEASDVFGRELWADDLNWISLPELTGPQRVKAKIRYKAPLAAATVYPEGKDRVHVRFDQPQRAITPGQAVVFYQEDVVMGGGKILTDPRGLPPAEKAEKTNIKEDERETNKHAVKY